MARRRNPEDIDDSEHPSPEDMLEVIQGRMDLEPEQALIEIPEGTKFVIPDYYNADPLFLDEKPSEEELNDEDGDYWDSDEGAPKGVMTVEKDDKYYFWDPRNAQYALETIHDLTKRYDDEMIRKAEDEDETDEDTEDDDEEDTDEED